MPNLLQRLRIDPYLLVLTGVIVLASLWPAHGAIDRPLQHVASAAIALLFFLQGARLSREAVINGLAAGRLHLVIVLATYALFPILALGLNATGLLPDSLEPGLLFLACLPSTIQSSIALISMARGNVAAAICAASLSNLLAVGLTPLLASALLHGESGGFSWGTLKAIVLQLLVPFAAGQMLRPLIGAFVARHRQVLGYVDRGSLLLVIYIAFSHAVVQGLWSLVAPFDFVRLLVACLILLAAALAAATLAARKLGLKTEEEITAVICGSQKSLATGAPMAGLLFAPALAGTMILPLMIYHQTQLILTTFLAQRYARRAAP